MANIGEEMHGKFKMFHKNRAPPISSNRPHTTVKNARNLKFVSQAKPPYFERIFKLSMLEQQDSSNVHQVCTPKSNNFLRETAVKRISIFLEILMLYEAYKRTMYPY